MLSTIKGYYENGMVVLNEKPPVKGRTEVMVTFLESQFPTEKKERIPGGLKGQVSLPDDFNAPLEDLRDYM